MYDYAKQSKATSLGDSPFLVGSLNISQSICMPFVLDYAFQILVMQLKLRDKG